MNIVSSHTTIPYNNYGYPVVTETSDTLLAPYEQQRNGFGNELFFKGFRKNSFAFNMNQGAGQYNKKRVVEPLAMQLIGTSIDLYA
jgi:hypothetical protein